MILAFVLYWNFFVLCISGRPEAATFLSSARTKFSPVCAAVSTYKHIDLKWLQSLRIKSDKKAKKANKHHGNNHRTIKKHANNYTIERYHGLYALSSLHHEYQFVYFWETSFSRPLSICSLIWKVLDLKEGCSTLQLQNKLMYFYPSKSQSKTK